MQSVKTKGFLALALLLWMICGQRTSCIEGVKILTRFKVGVGKYSLQHQCLCPIDFLGIQCRHHRQIRCLLTPKSISPQLITQQNFKQQMQISMSINMQCYVQNTWDNYIPLLQFLIQRKMSSGGLMYELQSGDYGGEIIWENNTDIFDRDGEVKYQEGFNFSIDKNGKKRLSQEDQQIIMNGEGPIKFEYKDNFFGIPLTDSTFFIIPKVFRPSHNSISFGREIVEFGNVEEYAQFVNQTSPNEIKDYAKGVNLQDLLKDPQYYQKILDLITESRKSQNTKLDNQTLPYFKSKVNVTIRDATEFKVIRFEISIVELYRAKVRLARTGVNGLQIMLPVRVPGVGEVEVYKITFNHPTISKWVYFIVLLAIMVVIYFIYIYRKRRQRQRNNQIKLQIEEVESKYDQSL